MRIRSHNQYNNAPSNNIQIVSFAFWLTTSVSQRIAPKKKLGAIIQLKKNKVIILLASQQFLDLIIVSSTKIKTKSN